MSELRLLRPKLPPRPVLRLALAKGALPRRTFIPVLFTCKLKGRGDSRVAVMVCGVWCGVVWCGMCGAICVLVWCVCVDNE